MRRYIAVTATMIALVSASFAQVTVTQLGGSNKVDYAVLNGIHNSLGAGINTNLNFDARVTSNEVSIAVLEGQTNGYMLKAGGTFTGRVDTTIDMVNDGVGQKELITKEYLDYSLQLLAGATLYGSTNAHPSITGAYSLVPDQNTEYTMTNSLEAGTNYIGTFYRTNAIVNYVPAGTYTLHALVSKSAARREARYVGRLVVSDGTTTNVLAWSDSSEDIPDNALSLLECHADIATNYYAPTGWFLGMDYYLVRYGNAVTVYTEFHTNGISSRIDLPSLNEVTVGLTSISLLDGNVNSWESSNGVGILTIKTNYLQGSVWAVDAVGNLTPNPYSMMTNIGLWTLNFDGSVSPRSVESSLDILWVLTNNTITVRQ